MPKYSVVVPVYNSEKFISDCLYSLQKQSYEDFEVIVIDDGSTDGSPFLCDEFARKDGRFKVFHFANQGVSTARNVGIEYSSGEYISFVDSDDIVSEDYFKRIDESIDGYDLLFFSNNRFFEDGSTVSQVFPELKCSNSKETEAGILKIKTYPDSFEYWGFTWNKCFKAEIIKSNRIRFERGIRYKEDEVFTNAYARHINSLRFISSLLYEYRESTTGLTKKKIEQDSWMKLCNALDSSTNGIESKELLNFEKNRIFEMYFNNNSDIDCHSLIYDFYRSNFPPCKSFKKKSLIFKCNRYLSFVMYSLYIKFIK